MANSFGANAFTNNFMQGFSFVDKIQSNKRDEARLEQRLNEERNERAFQKRRTQTQDQERLEDRAFTKLTREEERVRTQRARTATSLMSDPNVSTEQLQEFADFPEVANFLRDRGLRAQEQGDFETVFGAQQQAQGGAPADGAPQDPAAAQGLNAGVQPEALPGPQNLAPPEPLSERELNALADQDPAAAMQIRDEQATIPERKVDLGGGILPPDTGPSTRAAEVRAELKRDSKTSTTNNAWEAFGDINNQGGDALRNGSATAVTSQYHKDRNTLDPKIRGQADKRMGPKINEAIVSQTQALSVAKPGSTDARNATRKLNEALGVQEAIVGDYSPADQAGVNRGGIPKDGPEALTDSVIEQTYNGPGYALPQAPGQQKADATVVNRGVSGKRITKRQSDAAYRMYKSGALSRDGYETYIRTGKPPAKPIDFEQTDPKKDTWIVYPDGSRKLFQAARDPDKSTGRNVISDEGFTYLNGIARAYNTGDDKTRGTRMLQGFLTVLEQNESAARNAGYDYSNTLDVAGLYERYNNLYVIRDALNDEWFHNGEFQPDFTDSYGDIAQALFSPDVDTAFTPDALQSIDADDEGVSRLAPLKPRPPGFLDQVRQNAAAAGDPAANLNDQDLEGELRRQGL